MASDLKTFRERLLAIRAQLVEIAESSEEAADTVELDQCRIGRLTRMDAMQAQQMNIESERRRKQQLVNIEGALRRIDAGTFGICGACDEPIAEKRLNADPTCTRCIECAE